MSQPHCVNLKERFGHKYRVQYEESYEAERGDHGRAEEPWLMVIPARFGHFLPWGGDRLAASVDGHPNIAGQLRRLKCCRIEQDGDFGELTVSFHVDAFDQVAAIMRPHRKRAWSEKQRQEARERLAKYAFPPAVSGDRTAPESHDGGRDGSEAA